MICGDANIMRGGIEGSDKSARLEVVGAARNGREAVDLFRRTRPDVVTMDLTMPEMDGVECVQELVAINSKVLILVVSALAGAGRRGRRRGAGCWRVGPGGGAARRSAGGRGSSSWQPLRPCPGRRC